MAIVLRLDRMMADRKISLNELAEKMGIVSRVICWNSGGMKNKIPKLFLVCSKKPPAGNNAGGFNVAFNKQLAPLH